MNKKILLSIISIGFIGSSITATDTATEFEHLGLPIIYDACSSIASNTNNRKRAFHACLKINEAWGNIKKTGNAEGRTRLDKSSKKMVKDNSVMTTNIGSVLIFDDLTKKEQTQLTEKHLKPGITNTEQVLTVRKLAKTYEQQLRKQWEQENNGANK